MRRRTVIATAAVLCLARDALAAPVVGAEVAVDAPIIGTFGGGDARVASNGSDYLLVWTENRMRPGGALDLLFARVANDGSVPDAVAGVIATADVYPDANGCAVATDGSSFLVMWGKKVGTSDADLYGAIVAADGTLAKPPFPIATAPFEQRWPAVAFAGGAYFVAWNDCRASTKGCETTLGAPDVYGASVGTDGSVVPVNGSLLQAMTDRYAAPSLASDGSGFALGVETCTGACGNTAPTARVLHVATTGPIAGVDAASPGGPITLAASSGGALATWTNGATIELAAFHPSPLSLTSLPAVATSALKGAPIASSSGGALVAWDDGHDVQPHAYAARLDANGSLLDANGILVASDANVSDVGSNGNDYLVAFGPGKASRVDSKGSSLDSASPILYSHAANAETTPAVAAAADGTSLVVWDDTRAPPVPGETSPYAIRLDASGSPIDMAAFPISSAGIDEQASVASNGSSWVVVSRVVQSTQPGQYAGAIVARRVEHDGTIADASGVVLKAFDSFPCESPAVASDGNGYFAVWDCIGPGGAVSIEGVNVAADGTIGAAVAFPPAQMAASSSPARVAFDGTSYVVTWRDSATRAVHVTTAGTIVESSPITIDSTSVLLDHPVVACDGAGDCLLAWRVCMDESTNPCSSRIVGARVNGSGALDSPPFPISTMGGARQHPSVGFEGARYLVAWEDDRDGALDLFANWVAPSGKALAQNDFAIANMQDDETRPAVASLGGGSAIVAYSRFDRAPPYANARVRTRTIATTFASSGAPCMNDIDCSSGTCTAGTCCDLPCGAGGSSGGGGVGTGGAGGGGSGSRGAGTGGVASAAAVGGGPAIAGSGGSIARAGSGGRSSGGTPGAPAPNDTATAPVENAGGCGCEVARRGQVPIMLVAILSVGAATRRRRKDRSAAGPPSSTV